MCSISDNWAVSIILVSGSKNELLQVMAKEIYLSCKEKGILLTVTWKRRSEEEMIHVDLGSRGPWAEPEEFSLDFASAEMILTKYAPSVDAFACRWNSFRGRSNREKLLRTRTSED